jgi:hypothetical protein
MPLTLAGLVGVYAPKGSWVEVALRVKVDPEFPDDPDFVTTLFTAAQALRDAFELECDRTVVGGTEAYFELVRSVQAANE